MSDDRPKYDALIESKSWDTLTEGELADLRSAGIGREEYDSIRSALQGFDSLSDIGEGLRMPPEVRRNLMEMFDIENPPVSEEADPRVIRIRRIRIRFTAAAAAAAIILVASLWWMALRDENVNNLIYDVEVAKQTTEIPDATADHDAPDKTSSDPLTTQFREGSGGVISKAHVSEITQEEDINTISGSADTKKIAADDKPVFADALDTENKATEVEEAEVTGTKSMNLSSRKVSVEAYSDQAANMQVTSEFRVSKNKGTADSYSGNAAKKSFTGKPASEDEALLKFLYACR